METLTKTTLKIIQLKTSDGILSFQNTQHKKVLHKVFIFPLPIDLHVPLLKLKKPQLRISQRHRWDISLSKVIRMS